MAGTPAWATSSSVSKEFTELLVAQAGAEVEVRATLLDQLLRSLVDRATVAALAQLYATVPPATVAADLHACSTFDCMDRLSQLSIPALVIAGSDDVVVPPRYGQALAREIPMATYQELVGFGHHLPLEASEAVAEAIVRFVTDTSPSTSEC